MRDWGALRALFLDFGVDPRAIGTMSLGEIDSMCRAMEKRQGKPAAPKQEDVDAGWEAFADLVASDPSVRLH